MIWWPGELRRREGLRGPLAPKSRNEYTIPQFICEERGGRMREERERGRGGEGRGLPISVPPILLLNVSFGGRVERSRLWPSRVWNIWSWTEREVDKWYWMLGIILFLWSRGVPWEAK